jgi:predicted RNA-binding Zn ribbon-like protein
MRTRWSAYVGRANVTGVVAIDSYLKPVPDPGGPVLRFVNLPELLDDLDRFRALIEGWQSAPQEEPTPQQRARLELLQRTCRELGELVAAGTTPGAAELAPLNAFLEPVPVTQRLLSGEGRVLVQATAVASGWDEVIRDLAGWFAILLVRYEPERLKVCGNPDCRRLYFDASKNRTGRWCDDVCGNRMRVRRHRAAQMA